MVTDSWAWRFQDVQRKGYSVAFNKSKKQNKKKTATVFLGGVCHPVLDPVGQSQRKKCGGAVVRENGLFWGSVRGCPRCCLYCLCILHSTASLSWGEVCITGKSGVGRKVLVHGGHCWPRVCVFQHGMICLHVSCTSCRLVTFLSPGLSVSLVKSHSCWRI